MNHHAVVLMPCLPIRPSLPWQGCQRWPVMAPGSKGRSGHSRGWRWQSSPGLSPRSTLNIVAQTSSHAPGHTPRIWYSVVALKDTDLIVSVNFYIPPYYKSAVSVC